MKELVHSVTPKAADHSIPEVVEPLGAELVADGYKGRERWSFLHRLLVAADLLAGVVAGLAAGLVFGLSVRALPAFVALVALGWPALCFLCGLYSANDLRSWASSIGEAPRSLFALLALSWPLHAAAALLGAPSPAWAAATAALGCAVFGALTRGVARSVAHQSEPHRQRTLIVGSGVVARQVVDKLRSHPEFGLVPVGILDDEVHELESPDVPTLGSLDELSRILDSRAVDRVIIAFSRASHDELLRSLRACRDRGVAVDVVPRLFEFLDGARALDHVGGLPLLSIGAHELTASSRAAKRTLDLTVSAAALLVLSPLFLVLAIAIRLESRGPVFFRQPRAGCGGGTFRLFKFRSMYEDAEARADEFRVDGVILKGGVDTRITRVGAFLRRYSLDELPQLINVMTGDMSLVGPRPLVTSEAEALGEEWHERRLDLRPGMTGLWQVSGRSRIPFVEMLRVDYQYVAGWSLARDIEILLATVPAVLTGRGAY